MRMLYEFVIYFASCTLAVIVVGNGAWFHVRGSEFVERSTLYFEILQDGKRSFVEASSVPSSLPLDVIERAAFYLEDIVVRTELYHGLVGPVIQIDKRRRELRVSNSWRGDSGILRDRVQQWVSDQGALIGFFGSSVQSDEHSLRMPISGYSTAIYYNRPEIMTLAAILSVILSIKCVFVSRKLNKRSRGAVVKPDAVQ